MAYSIPAGGDDYRRDFTYDALDQVATVQFGVGTVGEDLTQVTETYRYDTAGRLREFTPATGYTTVQTFDNAGRIETRTIGAEANSVTHQFDYTYNDIGLLSVQTASGVTIESIQTDKLERTVASVAVRLATGVGSIQRVR